MTDFNGISAAAKSSLLIALFLTAVLLVFTMLFCRKNGRRSFLFVIDPIVFGIVFFLLSVLTHAFDGGSFERLSGIMSLPVAVFWIVCFAAAGLSAAEITLERVRRKKSLGKNSIKQAVDTLPGAVCYFSPGGSVKLCNHQMYRLYHQMTGTDLQLFCELEKALKDCKKGKSPVKLLSNERQTYLFPDGSARRFSLNKISAGENGEYTEAVFSDLSELYEKNLELKEQTEKLREVSREIKRLSDNVLELTREREILSAKTKIHDRMGAGLMAIRRLLLHSVSEDEAEQSIELCRRAVAAIKSDNENAVEKDGLSELLNDAEAIGAKIVIKGHMPKDDEAGRFVLSAVREGLANAVKHADAKTVTVTFFEREQGVFCEITNDGRPPKEEVVPKGGLLNLMRRASAVGADVKIDSLPTFKLTVIFSKKEDEK